MHGPLDIELKAWPALEKHLPIVRIPKNQTARQLDLRLLSYMQNSESPNLENLSKMSKTCNFLKVWRVISPGREGGCGRGLYCWIHNTFLY